MFLLINGRWPFLEIYIPSSTCDYKKCINSFPHSRFISATNAFSSNLSANKNYFVLCTIALLKSQASVDIVIIGNFIIIIKN